MNESFRYCLRPDVRFQRVADEGVVVRQAEGEVLVLNGVGMSVLEAIRPGASSEDLMALLSGEYAVAADELAADVCEFLNELIDAGVVECNAGGGNTA